jgi:hypothetical protein
MILYSEALRQNNLISIDNDQQIIDASYSVNYNNSNRVTTHRLEIKTKSVVKNPVVKFTDNNVIIDNETYPIYVQHSLDLKKLNISEDFKFIIKDEEVLEIKNSFYDKKFLVKKA